MRITLNKPWRSFTKGQTITGLHQSVYQPLLDDGTAFNTDAPKHREPEGEVKTGTPPGGRNKMMTREKAGALKGGLDP